MNSPNRRQLAIYSFLSRLRRPRTLAGKILLIVFLGTHAPLLALFSYAIASTSLPQEDKHYVFIGGCLATLFGAALTLYTLERLLAPIGVTYRALRTYLDQKTLPDLPTEYEDEAGTLMADTHLVISRLDQSLHYLTYYDSVTGLPNRSFFLRHLDQTIRGAAGQRARFALLTIDLTEYEIMRNGLGGEQGDATLRIVAHRLSSFTKEEGMLARIGDQTFALILPDIRAAEEVQAYVEEILDAIGQSTLEEIGGIQLHAAVGISLYPSDEANPAKLLLCSETALFNAKHRGGGEPAYFSSGDSAALRRRIEVEAALRGAYQREELKLVYQPIFNAKRGCITTAEALLRWDSPTLGSVPPGEFVPIAESNGLIVSIGERVLRHACFEAQRWGQDCRSPIKVSVNVSARQLHEANFVDTVARALRDSGLSSNMLQIEVTESAIMEDVDLAIEVLRNIRATGVKIALDDFGTGYSSLSYLKRLPLDVIKIDRAFTQGLPEDIHDLAIVRSVMVMAESLQLEVVAEGVETAEQAECLQKHGCFSYQGYLFGKPAPPCELWRSERLL